MLNFCSNLGLTKNLKLSNVLHLSLDTIKLINNIEFYLKFTETSTKSRKHREK